MAGSSRRLQLAAIMVGGTIGPFTGQGLAVVLPQVAEVFQIPLSLAALTISCYLGPFAAMMLFSGRLSSGISPHIVVRVAYAVTFPLALALLFVPSWWVFALCYSAIGIANAFTTPVLQSLLRAIVPAEQLGRALGTYAAMQSLGMLSAPLVSGFFAQVNFRLTFLVTAVASLCVLLIGVPQTRPSRAGDRGSSVRGKLTPIVVHMLTSFAVGFGAVGLGFMTSLYVGDAFGLASHQRGAVIMAGGLSALIFARLLGRAADLYGAPKVLITCCVVASAVMVSLPLAPSLVLVVLLWACVITACQGMQATINLAVLQGPAGSSLISTVQAFRYVGVALAPIVFLGIYTSVSAKAYWVSALIFAFCAVAQWWAGSSKR